MANPIDRLSTEELTAVLRAMLSTSPDAIAISSGGVLQFANPAFLALLGYDQEAEITGRSIFDIAAPAGHELIADLVRRRDADEPRPASAKLQLLRRDGSPVLVETRETVLHLAGEPVFLSFFREVPPAVPPEAMRQSAAFYRALFEVNSAVKLLICPVTGRILDANQAAADLYGWSLDELRSMRITDLNTLTPAEIQAEMDAARSRRRGYFRFRHRTADGSVRHVEVHSGPVEIENGTQLLLSIIHDVTERDQLEEQLRRAERLEAVGRLAGGIAHDFNNLLTIMLTSTRMLETKLDSDSPLARHVDDLSHAAQRAAELSTGLLAFGGSSAFKPTPLDIDEPVQQILRLLRRTLPATIRIEIDLAPDLPCVRADPTQIEQVIVNLALNARDAMPHGGVLRVRTGLREVDDGASMVPPGRWVTLTVSDTGVGMDESTRARAFEPFFTTKTSSGGTGLGLARVYGIVTQSGGHVTLESEPNAGSAFVVHLPPALDLPVQVNPTARRAPGTAPPSTILLVEDMEMVRSMLADALEAAGFTVLAATSADEALALPADVLGSVDALVSDVVMPGSSGFDLVETLLEARPNLPVVLMSGHDGHLDAARLPRSVCFLQKPFDLERLLEALQSARDAAGS